jgi:hypothetical protein
VGEIQVSGAIDGFVEFIPDATSLPTYSGTDGSSLRLTLSGKSTANGQGQVALDRSDVTCV